MLFRNIDEMSDRELLEELVKEKRRLQIWRYVKIIFFIIAVIVITHYARIYVPQIIDYVKKIKENVDYLNDTVTEIRRQLDTFENGTSDAIQKIQDFLSSLWPGSWFN